MAEVAGSTFGGTNTYRYTQNIHTHMHARTNTHTHTHVHTHKQTHAYAQTHAQKHTNMHTRTPHTHSLASLKRHCPGSRSFLAGALGSECCSGSGPLRRARTACKQEMFLL